MRADKDLIKKTEKYRQFFGDNLKVNLTSQQITKIMSEMIPHPKEFKSAFIQEEMRRKRKHRKIIFEV